MSIFEADFPGWPEKLSLAGITPASLGGDEPLPAGTGHAVIASLAANHPLRLDLVEGLSLFQVAAYSSADGHGPDVAKAESIVSLLRDKVISFMLKASAIPLSIYSSFDENLAPLHCSHCIIFLLAVLTSKS